MRLNRTRWALVFSCMAVIVASALYQMHAGAQFAPAAYVCESPRARNLDASLYVQTSAEYRASCYQAYNLAALRLKQFSGSRKDTSKPAAVIMDLDETVLSNAGFQASQLRSGLAYDQRLWDDWEENHSKHLGLVPGAKRFILEATKMGVKVIYVSNRNQKFIDHTKEALVRFELPIVEDGLLLNTGSNDKTPRFEQVKKKYDVLLMIGDNLRDFEEQFKCPDLGQKTPEQLEAAIQTRKDRVDQTESSFGERWIILPNPTYGEWTKPLGLGDRDFDRLVKAEK